MALNRYVKELTSQLLELAQAANETRFTQAVAVPACGAEWAKNGVSANTTDIPVVRFQALVNFVCLFLHSVS